MKRGWRYFKVFGISLLVFILVFPLGLMMTFPTSAVQTWINTLNLPGKVSVTRVHLDPIMRLRLNDLVWQPEKNPLVEVIVLKGVKARPSWSKIFLGKKVLEFTGEMGASKIFGHVEFQKKGRVVLSLATEDRVFFPTPFVLRRGVDLQGAWQLKGDVLMDKEGETGKMSGGWAFSIKNFHLKWPSSPLGRIDLSFISGRVDGNITRSVFNVDKIVFRGNMMDVDGTALFWRDPIKGDIRIKGTLYFRPKIGLKTSNAPLDGAIRMLPKDPRGFRLVF